jgi:hypothetical protein
MSGCCWLRCIHASVSVLCRLLFLDITLSALDVAGKSKHDTEFALEMKSLKCSGNLSGCTRG